MAGPGTCPVTGKRRYRDKKESLKVLHRAETARHWAEIDGTETRRCEVRTYQCPKCHGWHTTSQTA